MTHHHTRDTLAVNGKEYGIFRIDRLGDVSRLPISIRILLENALRNADGKKITQQHYETILNWPAGAGEKEIPYMPARVILQDFTGVPAVVDLSSMRTAMAANGKDPQKINPVIPADLIIDHSVQIDYFGTDYAYDRNVAREYERNRERYSLLRWGQTAFDNFRVVPPGTGIIHQVNLEYLARVVMTRTENGETLAFPDTVVGTDSHTTMINGMAVLGWGVGGIEAEAVMLGQPIFMILPEVIGFKLTGALMEGATATDLVLTVVQMLRERGVVGKFVEFFGPGLSSLTLPDRATLSNMGPEYGATMGFFPVDPVTLDYLAFTGREELVPLVEAYTKTQHMFRSPEMPDPEYSDVLELDMATVIPCVAGPRRPQDRIPLTELPGAFGESIQELRLKKDFPKEKELARIISGGMETDLTHGSLAIASITSCTNTSNPSVLIGAGLLAKKAVEKGLTVRPYVKTSLAPGSRVVTEYLKDAGLLPYLEALRFHVVGYGCATCIGNTGPLPPEVERAIDDHNLVVASALSGNRNFEARIHAKVRANYLASPVLVVAYALAGRIDIDFEKEAIGKDPNGQEVFLKEIWPSQEEIRQAIEASLSSATFKEKYAGVFEGDETWRTMGVPEGDLYDWDPASTYIQNPPFFTDITPDTPGLRDIENARVLAVLGDTVTTDHISPAGSIPPSGPAGTYLLGNHVDERDFNTYGSRRGNHEVMMRGTFANVRLKNLLLDDVEGGYTVYFPTGEEMPIYDACMKYQTDGIPLVVLGGKEYGTGSSRDWAAKGTQLLGVKAVIAESYERIHRSNLVGMGVLPLQFKNGESRESLGLTGREILTIHEIKEGLTPRKLLNVTARKPDDGSELTFQVNVRLDSDVEIEYYRNGGILHTVLRNFLREA